MKTKIQDTAPDRNPDPITGEPGSHPVGVGLGTAGGAAAGAAVGALGGPVGAVVGAVVGGIAGAAGGKAAAEAIDPTEEDRYWQEKHASQEYADPDFAYDDYRPAYSLGYTGPGRYHGSFQDFEQELRAEWENNKGESRLDWPNARPAVNAGWDRVQKRNVTDRGIDR